MNWSSRNRFPVKLLALLAGALMGFVTSLPEIERLLDGDQPPVKVPYYRRLPKSWKPPVIISKPGIQDPNEGIIMPEKSKLPIKPMILPKTAPFKVNLDKLGPVVNPHDYHYTIDPKEACRDPDIFMVAYIHTAPDHTDRRALVRRTWGAMTQYKGTKLRLFFMIGLPRTQELQKTLEEEAKKYGDLVQENFMDSYHNLSIKAVGAMRWVTTRCKQAKFILKSDDDVFVNLFGLLPHMQDLDIYNVNNTCLLMCLVWNKMHVLREGKWGIPRSVYAEDVYPHYCSGMAYIFTPDVAESIYRASMHVRFFWVDDAYITGIIPKAIGLKHVDIGRIMFGRREAEWVMSGRDWYKYAFSSHFSDMKQYEALWKTVKRRAMNETIPKMTEIVAGKLASEYGPKKPPEWFVKELEMKQRKNNLRLKNLAKTPNKKPSDKTLGDKWPVKNPGVAKTPQKDTRRQKVNNLRKT